MDRRLQHVVAATTTTTPTTTAIFSIIPQFQQISHILFFLVLSASTITIDDVHGWPDGAPCLRTVMDSMNPLEAVEHQGGLQLTSPPFHIEVDQLCYRPGQAISLTLRGNITSMEFKGFAIQPLVYEGLRTGKRSGQFVRLDDNGSWQYQCFRNRDSITHSHDEGKNRIKIWWRGDSSMDAVQFTATVVQSLRRFWVKSVLSVPLPPCSLRTEFGPWQAQQPTVPPPTDQFRLETFEMFNGGQSQQIAQSLSRVPVEEQARFPHVLPESGVGTIQQQQQLASVFFRTPNPQFQPITPAITVPPPIGRPQFPQQRRNFFPAQQSRQPFAQQQSSGVCRDQTPQQQCLQWFAFCSTSAWMQQFCRSTCRLC